MAVIIGGIRQEVNSFCALKTKLSDFSDGYMCLGDDILEKLANTKTGIAGFVDVLTKYGRVPFPTIAAQAASPAGVVEKSAWLHMRCELLNRIEAAFAKGLVEGVLLNMHGAMVAEDCDDTEGNIAQAVRMIVGNETPIAMSLDAHAYVSKKMLENLNIIVGFSTFPHIDEYETAFRAGELLIRMLEKAVNPVMAAVSIPMLLSPEAQQDKQGALALVLGKCRDAEERDGVESITFFPVQPWLDIENTASQVLVIADGDADIARQTADEIAVFAWNLRTEFVSVRVDPDEAVQKALNAQRGPIVLSEAADSPPAGAAGDSNRLLKALLNAAVNQLSFVTVIDPAATAAAFSAGVGNTVETDVGYNLDSRWGEPIRIEGIVMKLDEKGMFMSQMFGMPVTMGRTAVIGIGEVRLVVCEKTFIHLDPNSYRYLGLNPEDAKIVGVKSTQHFRYFYESIAADIHLLEMTGPSSSNFASFDWKRLSRPIWPLDEFNWPTS